MNELMTEATEQNSDGLQQLGQKLREVREQKQLSLENVAETTRINIEILKKIEQGQLEQGPAPVFMRGFIRTYSTLLGLDNEMLQEEFDKIPELQENSNLREAPGLPPQLDSSSWHKKLTLVVLSLLILVAGYFTFANLDQMHGLFNEAFNTSEPQQENIAQLEPTPAPEKKEEVHEPSTPSPEKESSPVELSQETTAEPMVSANTEPEKPEPPSTPEVVMAPPTVEPVSDTENTVITEKLQLSIKALATTWLDITVDNDNPIEISLQSGEEFSSEANEQYVLTIGNAKGVQLFLNGKLQIIDQQKDLLENLVLDQTSLTSSE